MEALGCVLNPGQCIDQAVAAWVAWFPFGVVGIAFVAGMICGAILGKLGVLSVIGLGLAVIFGQKKTPDAHEHVTGNDAAPPVPKKKPRKPLF